MLSWDSRFKAGIVGRCCCMSILCAILACTGCSPTGPLAVPGDRFNYNQAAAQSTREQLLLNIVRLRYHEPICMLEIGSMISSHTLKADASMTGWRNNLNELENPALMAIYGNDKHPTQQYGWGAGLEYSDSPTITYTPVQGEKFASRMMTAIPMVTIFQLCQSGWGIDQLLECCVQRINGISNLPLAGIRDVNRPPDPRFNRVAKLLRTVQDAGLLLFEVEAGPGGGDAVFLRASPEPPTGLETQRQEMRELLGYSGDRVTSLRLVPAPFKTGQDELAMQTRSLLGVMWALSRGVAVPADHVQRGWADDCTGVDEGETQWLHVGCSALPRPDAYVQVWFKGTWFYVEESDACSKRTLALLDYLFSLQHTDKGPDLPVVTVPAK